MNQGLLSCNFVKLSPAWVLKWVVALFSNANPINSHLADMSPIHWGVDVNMHRLCMKDSCVKRSGSTKFIAVENPFKGSSDNYSCFLGRWYISVQSCNVQRNGWALDSWICILIALFFAFTSFEKCKECSKIKVLTAFWCFSLDMKGIVLGIAFGLATEDQSKPVPSLACSCMPPWLQGM